MINTGWNNIRKHALRAAGCLAAAAALCSCIKEEIPAFDDAEGRPTTVQVALELPAMDIRTRAMMSKEDDSKVSTLWVGTFQASTGQRTGQGIWTRDHSDEHNPRTLTLETKSGPSRIVAVANIERNYGTTSDETLKKALQEAGKPTTEAGYYELRDMLELVETWEQYKSIRAAHINPANVSSFDPNLIMAGVYYENKNNDPGKWDTFNEKAVTIPASNDGKVSLPGAIHLRRLLAYVRFDIRWEAADNIDDLDVDLKSWKVINNPTFSYVHEQQANAGDAVWDTGYAESNISRNFVTTTRDNLTYRTFDFYQFENRHTGLDDVTNYNDREREHKNVGGANTGIYASLCRDATDGPDNRATYVEIEAEVAYKTTIDGMTVDRTGTARYCVHLGYCEGADEAAKAKDFNCRRNTKYTYTMVIKGLDKIVVEARREGETQPGAEGEVFDTYEQTIDLDAHYGTFNIQLSDDERAKLEYVIYAPYGDGARTINSETLRQAAGGGTLSVEETGDELHPFYQWIRFRPTTGENVLAKYSTDGSKPWTLEQLRDVEGHPGSADDWYTVFIDEYVYHDADDTGNEEGNEWWNYVNKDPRTVYLAIRESEISDDGESRYGYSKYLIRQQSIQTYYATSTVGGSQIATKALGAEHTNETYGLNLRWTNRAINAAPSQTPTITGSEFVGYGWNPDNGRVNVRTYLDYSGNGRDWDTYFTIKDNGVSQGEIPTNLNSTPDPVIAPKEGKYYLPQLNPTRGSGYNTTTATKNGYACDPNKTQTFYEVMELCLSRNRDLNGNGKIDDNEIRWYLPALGKYTRMVLGRQSLQDPLIDPSKFDPAKFPGVNNDTYNNPWFHYVSSDGMVLLNEQGLSLERKGVTGQEWFNSAWQVRCIRNLGCDLRQVVDNDPVQAAYTIDTKTRTVEMTYYDQSSIRQQAMEVIPIHPITSELNLPYKKFRYAQADCNTNYTNGYDASLRTSPDNRSETSRLYLDKMQNSGGNGTYYQHVTTSAWQNSNDNNSICSRYYEEADQSDQGKWRIPNQKELTILRRAREEAFTEPNSSWMWQWISCSHFIMGTDSRVAGIYCNNGRMGGSIKYWGNGYIEYSSDPTVNQSGGNLNTYTRVRCVRDVIE